MSVRTLRIPLTTDASGDASTTRLVSGQVLAVFADADAYADTVDITVTDDISTEVIASFANLAADAKRRPRVVATQPDGTALTTLLSVPAVVMGRLKVVVAQGGNTLSGVVYVTIDS